MNQFPGTRPRLGDVRVLTLNLWGRHGVWADRRTMLIDGLLALQPDLLAFQESIKNDEYDQVIDLLGPGWNIVHQQSRDPEGMGISIASRWPLLDVQEVDLHVTPRTKNFPCGTLIAEVLAPEPVGPLLLVNHFPNWQLNFEYERELQAVAAARVVEERARLRTQQVVLVGDQDAAPDATSIRFWSGRQSLFEMSVCYRDVWESTHPGDPGHTFTSASPIVREQVVKDMRPFRDWPFRRIDYIFVRYGEHGGLALDILGCARIFDEPVNGVWASDHFGLLADLAAPEQISTPLKGGAL
ncbi:MAG TPA: endonuclease/exonuclease/phosphatase family protein [Ktedonobacteraceae bacterium]|nr:endonuclease/exonuclease/phosphatase family protein [Ktedonobacteraceae bacterium]